MHKIIKAIIEQLEAELATALSASQEAHRSATHSENVADNKYDTLAVEAAYLAHGQSLRIEQLQKAIHLYTHFVVPAFNQQSSVEVGALLKLESIGEGVKDAVQLRHVFLGPAEGGLSVKLGKLTVQVLTTEAPLGEALLNKLVDDEFDLSLGGKKLSFRILNIQ
ncbi:MAG: transcription elongation factor GreAB [SAR86 cluster bacterium]|uniref:Transcription elongation factor GreAB n=1 Tax=SAR86 cluster bacterium TaxID=2030880 RepID=A0A2A4MMW5_9GAMM|nr:MAG: transcription elongation factor GreAB [SAR86 cluster bacterium]